MSTAVADLWAKYWIREDADAEWNDFAINIAEISECSSNTKTHRRRNRTPATLIATGTEVQPEHQPGSSVLLLAGTLRESHQLHRYDAVATGPVEFLVVQPL